MRFTRQKKIGEIKGMMMTELEGIVEDAFPGKFNEDLVDVNKSIDTIKKDIYRFFRRTRKK